MIKSGKSTAIPPPTIQPGFPWLLAILISGITFLVFSPALQNKFVDWDDGQYFLANFNYRGLSWSHLQWMFTTFYMGQYSPLAWLSSGLDYSLWGMDPKGYHLTSILIHSVNAALFFALILQVLPLCMPQAAQQKPRALLLAAAAAALFYAIHPLRVESVAWATERRDVLCGLFLILTILFYVRSRIKASLVLFLCAMLSKASVLGVPLLLLCLDYYPLHRVGGTNGWFKADNWPVWREKLMFALIALPFAGIAFFGQFRAGAAYQLQDLSLAQRAAVMCYGSVFYLWKTLFPFHLSPLYELPQSIHWAMPMFFLSATALVLLTVLFYRSSPRWPAGWVLWLSYLILFAPTSGVVQSGSQLAADRFSYFSCMGWSILLGAGLFTLWQSPIVSLGSLMVLSALGVLTYQQTTVWQTTETLWVQAIKVSPESIQAKVSYSDGLIQAGRYTEAKQVLQDALRLDPQNADTLCMLGKLAAHRHDIDEAAQYYQQALQTNPHQLDAHMNIGLICLNRNQVPEAIAHFQAVLQENPDYAEAHVNLGIAYAMQKNLDLAIGEFKQALKLHPGFDPAEANLSRALAMQKQ